MEQSIANEKLRCLKMIVLALEETIRHGKLPPYTKSFYNLVENYAGRVTCKEHLETILQTPIYELFDLEKM